MRIRVGVVGCGKIAERHLNAYHKLDDVEVVVTDIVERGRDVAARYEAGWHPDPLELVSGAQVDAVDVCTPTPTHAELIRAALESGKPVFCEKPLARTLDEARTIAELVQRTGNPLSVGYLYRFHPAFEWARNVLREGALGDPYYATFRLGGRGSHKAWKHKVESGGGAGNEMLVHMLDLALWWFGEPTEIEPLLVSTVLPEREVEGELVRADAEDLILLRLQTAAGVTALVQSDLITPGYMNHVEVQGTNGSLMTSILDFLPSTLYCKEPVGVYDRGRTTVRFDGVDLFERELSHWLASVRGLEAEAINSVHDSVRLLDVLERVLPRVDHV